MAGAQSTWVAFPGFRQYEAVRQEANNAMMALLAGSKLAAHTLQLTTGSHQLLPDIFPGVEHIRYFSLRTDAATELLLDTGHHLGAVAVPYALAVHEDFVMTTLGLLDELGYAQKAPGDSNDPTRNRIASWNMHDAIYMTLGQPRPLRGSVVELENFHLIREMRNAHIHNGGAVSPRLKRVADDMDQAAAAEWVRLARRAPKEVTADDTFRFTTFDIFAVFATTKALGRRVNALLRDGLATNEWARICIDDYSARTSKTAGSDRWIRGLVGHAAAYYGTVLSKDQVVDAAVGTGKWPPGRTFVPRRSAREASRPRDRGTHHS